MVLSALVATAHTATEAAGVSPVTGGTGLWTMVLDASPMVKAIIFGLFGLSVLCWGIVLSKARQIRKAEKESERFLDLYSERKNNDTLRAVGFQLRVPRTRDPKVQARVPTDDFKGLPCPARPFLRRFLLSACGDEL